MTAESEVEPEDDGTGITGAVRLTPEQWDQIYHLIGEGTPVTLAAKAFGISHQAVSKRIKEKGLIVGAIAATRKLAEEAEATRKAAVAAETFGEALPRRRETTKARHANLIDLNGMMLFKRLKEMALTPVSAKEHLMVTRTIALVRQEAWKIYGMDAVVDKEELPDLNIADLNDQDLADIHEAQKAPDLGEEDLPTLDDEPDDGAEIVGA